MRLMVIGEPKHLNAKVHGLEKMADDFVLGEFIAQAGNRVVLSTHIPDHLVCKETMESSLRYRLRWARSSRGSRPAGYFGQVFMHSLPLALLTWLLVPAGNPMVLPLVAVCLAARAAASFDDGSAAVQRCCVPAALVADASAGLCGLRHLVLGDILKID